MPQQRDVHLFVVDTLADWEPGLAVAHINRPAPGVPSRYRVRTVGLDRTPIVTLGNIRIVPDLTVDELSPADSAMLILPGSDLYADPKVEPMLAKARAFVDAGVPIAAICGATLGLARAGILDDRKHTSNAKEYLAASEYKGGARYVTAPVVDDRGVITAPATSPLEFAHAILARLEVFSPAALDAWYGLYKTSDPACYAAFMRELNAA
jgi:putative intracellular protease/amidase